jgi:hypothetical protein
MNVPALKTRRPSGKPPWPMLCIAGVEKSGKSYSAAVLSASDLIDRTFYIELGEGAADQYGDIPGARYEIVEHDGTFNAILGQAQAAVQAPRNGKPHAIVVDSVTELWDLLSDEAQLKANRRAAAKAAEKKRPAPAEDVQITMDLWNDAKKKWRRFIDTLRVYDGPVVLLARLELVAVMEGGKPSEAREWKIRAEKNLPFECDAIVKMRAPQDAALTGVRSTKLQVPPGREMPLPKFSIDGLLRSLGLDVAGATAPRSYTAPKPVADDQPDRPAERHHTPVDDEWNTATSQQLPPPAPGMPTVTVDEINEIVRLLGVKRGVYNGQCAGVVSQLVQRRIDDPRTLSQSEARGIIETLTAAPDQPPAAPAPPGSPNNPLITTPEMRMIQGLFSSAGMADRDKQHAFIARVLGAPVASRNDLTHDQFVLIRQALTTGEIPPAASAPPSPAGPNANGEGISEFDALDQMILDVASDQAAADAQAAIGAELARGGITRSDADLLMERLIAHVEQAKAGVSS